MTQQSEEALEALRGVWQGTGQDASDLVEVCDTPRKKECRNVVHMTFDGYAEEGEDVQTAWRNKLEAEGKRSTKGGSLADLIFGTEPPHQG